MFRLGILSQSPVISIKLSTCLLSTCQTWPRFCFHTVLNTEPTFNLRIFKMWLVFVLIQFWTLNLHSHGCLRQVNVGQFLWYSVTMSAGTAPAPALCTQTAGELFTVHDDRCVSSLQVLGCHGCQVYEVLGCQVYEGETVSITDTC